MLKHVMKLLPAKIAFAHCDIPCGIYDPYPAQIAAHTIIRMTDLIMQAHEEEHDDSEESEEIAERVFVHQVSRMTHVKESHGAKVEEELSTLLFDYFKPEHFEQYKDLQKLIYDAIKLSGKVRQSIDKESANQLLEKVQQVAEIFWKTKGFEVVRIPSGYPTEGEIVSHK